MIPQLIKGGTAVDERGRLSFVNDFNFDGVKRFYVIRNHAPKFLRAWHGHKHETKYVTVLTGAAIVAAVEIDNWVAPNASAPVIRFTMSEYNPQVLRIPAGYANGILTLTEDTVVMVFSTSTVEESINDDYRYPARYWNPWTVEER